mgnify:CR=1 FL=1
MKIKTDKVIIMFFFILISSQSYFYLIDDKLEILKIQPSDLALIFALFWAAFILGSYQKLNLKRMQFAGYMVFFAALIFLSSLQSQLLFGQSIKYGLIQQRRLLIWISVYFAIELALIKGKFNYEQLVSMIRIIGRIELAIYISQYFLYDYIHFLYVSVSSRYNDVRFYFTPTLLDFLFMIEMDFLLNKYNSKREKIKSGITIVLILFEVMIVQKFRLTTMALICCFVLCVLIKRFSKAIKFIYVMIAVLGICILLNTTMFRDIIEQFSLGFTDYGHFGIRADARKLYLEMLAKHPFLGGGYPYIEDALEASGYYKRMYLVDNGVFGFIYIYGGVGIIWIAALWTKLIKMSRKVFENKNITYFLLFYLFFIVTCINELHWYYDSGIGVFILSLCILDAKYNELYKMSIC